jgi:hypothetical protein
MALSNACYSLCVVLIEEVFVPFRLPNLLAVPYKHVALLLDGSFIPGYLPLPATRELSSIRL